MKKKNQPSSERIFFNTTFEKKCNQNQPYFLPVTDFVAE